MSSYSKGPHSTYLKIADSVLGLVWCSHGHLLLEYANTTGGDMPRLCMSSAVYLIGAV